MNKKRILKNLLAIYEIFLKKGKGKVFILKEITDCLKYHVLKLKQPNSKKKSLKEGGFRKLIRVDLGSQK